MSAISDIVKKYADGDIGFQQARELMRPIEPAPYEHSDPYANEWVEHEGGVVELQAECTAYDLTFGEYAVLRDELFGNEVDESALDDPSRQKRMGIHLP